MPEVRYLRMMISGVPVVTAPADIDITTAGQLRAVLVEVTGAGHPVVVDMTHTRFCDASGLHTLLRAHKRALSDGGELRLVIPADGAVSRVLYLTCLDHVIPCFSGLDEALTGSPPRPGTASSAHRLAMPEPRAPVSRRGGQLATAD